MGQVNIVRGIAAEAGGGGGLPLRNAAIIVSSGAAFGTYNSPTVNNNFTLNGGAGPNSNGAIQNQGGGTTVYTGTINLSSGNSNIGTGYGNITVSGQVTGTGALTEIGGNTLTLSGANNYTGGTTVSGGTLVLNAGNGSGIGTIVGTLNINPGATVVLNDKDALGWNGNPSQQVTAVNMVGGTMYNNSSTQAYATNFYLTGGTLGGVSSTDNQTGYHFANGYGVTTYGSTATSMISSQVILRMGSGESMVFNVAGGSTANGVDLAVTGMINAWNAGAGITKTGNGLMELAAANTYTGGTTVSGGTLQVTGSLANNGSNKVFVAKDTDGVFGDGSGDAAIVRRVAASGTYAGLGSSITNLGTGELSTTADILDGSASAQADVGMAWRTRTAAEKTQGGGGLISETLNLGGIASYGGGIHDGSHQTDTFVLQMNYDPSQLSNIWGLTESQAVAENRLYLGSLNLGADGLLGTADDQWINAVDDNFGGTPNFVGDQPYNSSYFVLGDYGVDVQTHTVWAVLNHNSDFAVVPEPSTLVLLAAGAIGLVAFAWRRCKAMA